MEKWVELNKLVTGKDKLARLIQYLSRIIWDHLQQNDCNPALIDQFKSLEYTLSSFRKLLCFGRFFEIWYSSLKTVHYSNQGIQMSLTFSKISQTLFLLCDHIIWLSRSGFIHNINSNNLSIISSKYWLLSIIMNLSRDVCEIKHLIDLNKRFRLRRSYNTNNNILRLLLTYLYEHRDIVIDIIKNLCDLFIPLTILGYTNFTPRTIGIFGVLSSIAGIIAIIDPKARLIPS